MPKAAIGKPAPDFDLVKAGGGRFKLSDHRGRIIVLYFYPGDDTPTCTQQAVSFSAETEAFAAAGALVVGVSPDDVPSHDRFVGKHGLTVTLLADPDREAIEAYGVWTKKTMFGRSYMGVARSTFLIDAAGTLVAEWRKVRLKGHIDAVLDAVRKLRDA